MTAATTQAPTLTIVLVLPFFMLVCRHGNAVLTRQLRAAAVTQADRDEQVRQSNVYSPPATAVFLPSQLDVVHQAALCQIRQIHVLHARRTAGYPLDM